MGRPLVSIVMVNYNHEDFIKDAIDSVLQQTYDNWELIIVDDGSTDSSVDIIRQYDDPRVKLYAQKENRHICVATNLGFSYVAGEFVARLDSDDVWRADKLEKQVRYFEENPKASVCFTKLDIINREGLVINQDMEALYNLYNYRQESREGWIRFFFFCGNSLIQSTMLMKRELLDRVGKFNLAYMQAHDFDFFVRMIQMCDFFFIEEPLVGYRRNECQNSAVHPENDRRFFNEFMNIRYHFFDHFPDDLFIRTFQEYFVNKESRTHEELLCEQAFLLFRRIQGGDENPLLGLLKLEELFRESQMADLLWEKYHYGPKSYYKENAHYLYYTDELEREKEELKQHSIELENELYHKENHVQQLLGIIGEQQKQIEAMLNSRSWKVTKPLRTIKEKIKRL